MAGDETLSKGTQVRIVSDYFRDGLNRFAGRTGTIVDIEFAEKSVPTHRLLVQFPGPPEFVGEW